MTKYYFEREIKHSGLNKYRVVKGETKYELDQKASAIQAQWNEQWVKKCEAEKRRQEKEQIRFDTEKALAYADKMTKEAELVQYEIENIIKKQVKGVSKDLLYDKSTYTVNKPIRPTDEINPMEPHRVEAQYNKKLPFLAAFSKKKKNEFIKNNDDLYQQNHTKWLNAVEEIKLRNEKSINEYQIKTDEWQKGFNDFRVKKEDYNKQIDCFFTNFEKGDKNAIERYYLLFLNQIKLPFLYDREVEIEYFTDSKILVIDIVMPSIDAYPTLKKVTYVKSTGEYSETYHTETYLKKMYDKAIYDLVLLILNTSFEQDKANNIEAIVLNGKVSTIDKASGNEISPYILSVNISKENFKGLNLEFIDSKEWFKGSRGVSAATFSKVTPVAPVIKISREDDRFIEGYQVVDNIDDTVNLAAIDWQDFENLIREIFHQEFSSNGGEVKITQASRDGGVDAIAFDPDPIRGGKIVIQAKRYTNVVGVSAVRDLYGTVMNEGATKGILVTTSNYGNDAYEFAKGKPLTLMNGANLLYLLEKHGHKAKIDLAKAKELLKNE